MSRCGGGEEGLITAKLFVAASFIAFCVLAVAFLGCDAFLDELGERLPRDQQRCSQEDDSREPCAGESTQARGADSKGAQRLCL